MCSWSLPVSWFDTSVCHHRYESPPPSISISQLLIMSFQSKPLQRTLTRYFDATHVTAKLQPTLISKVNTAVQLATIAASLAAPVYGILSTFRQKWGTNWTYDYWYSSCYLIALGHSTLVGMWYFTGFTTAAAATSYILSKDTYQFIKNSKTTSKWVWTWFSCW